MADPVRISNLPDSGSPHRVAYDLMVRIANAETAGGPNLKREATLRLYAECLRTVHNAFYEAPPHE